MGFVVFKGYGETHTAPVGVPTLSTLSVGSIVKIDEGGTPVEYLVVNQGIPEGSALYDESCNGTWLLRKEPNGSRKWDSTENDYESSEIHAYLNGDFLDLYDYNVRNLIKEVKIPYHKGTGSYGSVASGAEGLPAKAFLLGGYEVGFTTATHINFPVDGAALAYFKNAADKNANRMAYIGGTRYKWWTRSAQNHNTNGVFAIDTSGLYIGEYTYANVGVRPAIILPSNTLISQNDDGSVNLIVPEITRTPLSELREGSVVMINEGGAPVEYLVANQGIPANDTAMYDESCNGTWLLRKDILSQMVWDDTDSDYRTSNVHSYLNSTFLDLFDGDIQSAIKQVKLPYVNGTGTSGAVYQGSMGLSTKAFLLSGYEVNWSISTDGYFPVDGACLDYFKKCAATDAKRISYYKGEIAGWALRSPYRQSGNIVFFCDTNGAKATGFCTAKYHIRPALVLPSDLLTTTNPNGSYTL